MRSDKRQIKVEINRLVEIISEETGIEVIRTRYFKQDGRRILRVTINVEGGVTLSHCEKFSKRLSDLLDLEDVIPERYYLEVESPGI